MPARVSMPFFGGTTIMSSVDRLSRNSPRRNKPGRRTILCQNAEQAARLEKMYGVDGWVDSPIYLPPELSQQQ